MPESRGRTITVALVLGAAAALLQASAPIVASERDRLLGPGRYKIEGTPMRCGGVPTLVSRTFWDYGGAHRGMIIVNPDKMKQLPAAVRRFVYAHECGHHIYGVNEIKADCYAIQRGRKEGWLSPDGLIEVCGFFRDHPGDWVHPPGPERCRYIVQCFDGKQPPARSGASSLGPAR